MLRLSAPFSGQPTAPQHRDAARRCSRRKRRQTYPAASGAAWSCQGEVGGRWNAEAASFLRLLARARACATPAALCPAAQAAWVFRWSGLVAVAAQRVLATTFPEKPLHAEQCAAGPAPALHELLADAHWTSGLQPSRITGRP